jgi:hypothetical protein
VHFQALGAIVHVMNTVFASGVNAFQNAATRLEQASGQIARVRASTIPAASPQDAPAPSAVAGRSLAPPPPADPGGRASSLPSASIIEARVEMIRANQQAALAATSIRAADDMVGELLDVSA